MRIGEVNKLRSKFDNLGRVGISERAIKLMKDFVEKTPDDGREACHIIGRMYTLYTCIPKLEYWCEVADRGVSAEYDNIVYNKDHVI
ncbi:MAG TPA: hypothetical protein VJ327_11055 [Patescibacteria group bacterium]|nr:hypothetical protein [Patescibacteria group bacterium]